MAYAVTDIADLCPSKASETEKKIVNCTQAIESKKYSGAGLAGLLRNRGIVFAEELQEYGHAIADYSVALHLDSSGSDTYFNRALAYAAHGETEKTIADYRESIKLSPKVTDAYYDRGGIYFATNNYPSAIADYSAAILIDPKNSKALSGRGLRMPLQRSMAKLSRTSMRPFVLILKARKRITVAASCFTGKRNMTRIYLIVTPR
ncbi:tetratricopeptide repeat protein [Pseudomonas sp. NPDC096950]|uniref:tetratricopeptide repeat protein n=1 Tax=Pseudomonas sp. NPDC096950 TaxID=3364485 RepID=UPI003839FBE3